MNKPIAIPNRCLYTMLFACCCFLLVCLPFSVSSASQESENTPAQESKSEVEEETGIIQLYTWAGILPKELVDLKGTIDTDTTVGEISKKIPEITSDIEDFQWQVSVVRSLPDVQLYQIDAFQVRLIRIQGQLAKYSKSLTKTISQLAKWRELWSDKSKSLVTFKEQKHLTLALEIEQQDSLEKMINEGLAEIEERLTPALIVGKQLADLKVSLHTIDAELKTLDREVRKVSTQQTAPSILSLEFYKRVNVHLLRQSFSSLRNYSVRHFENLKSNSKPFIFGVMSIALLCFLIAQTRSLLPAFSHWHPFASLPLATAIFILSTFYGLFNVLPNNLELSRSWEEIIPILSALALIRLIRYIIDDTFRRSLFTRLIVFMIFTHLLVHAEVPQLLLLFFVFYASVVALIFYFYRLRSKHSSDWNEWARKLWGIVPLFIIILGIAGYDQLAVDVFVTVLATVASCLGIWILFLLSLGILEIILRLLPIDLLQENSPHIVNSLRPLFVWFHALLLIAVLSVVWNFFPTVSTAADELSNLGLDFFGLRISPGFLLTIFFVLYGAFLFSNAIQTLLSREVFPRYKAEKGVQISTNRLVHYAILTVGFFIMLRILGFDLKQLTLIGGALGVGIGFGLQAIVNNFASGLILLFERPVKVGDTVQIGEELGEVKELGLRATIIQTFDNAEIVVPNSDLVTGPVTNWTLADRRVRVKVQVGVAYGSDVSEVLEILKTSAENNPMVLTKPEPIALFLAFGASSLDFELRVWIPDFLEKTQVLSDLNQALETEFSLKGIEIPFPQTDLHLRSVTEQAATALQPAGGTVANSIDKGDATSSEAD